MRSSLRLGARSWGLEARGRRAYPKAAALSVFAKSRRLVIVISSLVPKPESLGSTVRSWGPQESAKHREYARRRRALTGHRADVCLCTLLHKPTGARTWGRLGYSPIRADSP